MSAEEPSALMMIKLMPDWGTGPLWVAKDGVSEPYDTDEITEVLSLSAELRTEIAAWDNRFQATFNAEYPPDSAFPTPEDEAVFIADGRELARRVQTEVPGAVVLYETIDGKSIPVNGSRASAD
ncbi:hypothetical protein ACFQV2_39865 [Actinokineospora soli]|uniref:DUF1902 domain-containing protein n=1 Tax=Actinokineospora soli TaxID=1048753 RepID=A0ABW2TXP5_9PSEU